MTVAAATALAWEKLRFPTTGIDDANIFFVYARNISDGQGFVFNPGGERVEGFTSFLWVLICRAAMALSGEPERPLLALNVLLVSLTIIYCLRTFLFRRAADGERTSWGWVSAFLILLLLDFRYIAWNTVTLMETALWACLLTTATVTVVDASGTRTHAWRFAGLVGLMTLTRPEALVWVPVVCGLFYISRVTDSRATALGPVVPGLLVFALTIALLTIFRLAYFGRPLPNTYYAKVSPSLVVNITAGASYFWRYLSSGPIPLACVLAVIFSIGHLIKQRFRDQRTLALTVMAIVGLTIPIVTGGDHFDGFRFYQAVYPILLLALLNWVRFIVPQYVAIPGNRQARATPALVATAALLGLLLTIQIVDWVQFDSGPLRTEFDIAATGRRKGDDLNALFAGMPRRPDIATIGVGGLKYTYSGNVIDLMGLNNTTMAHNNGDRAGVRSHAAFEKHTFYELDPTIVAPLVQYSDDLRTAGLPVPFVDRVLKGLLQEKRFQDAYRLAEVRQNRSGGVTTLAAWYHREFLSDLARYGNLEILFRTGPESEPPVGR